MRTKSLKDYQTIIALMSMNEMALELKFGLGNKCDFKLILRF